MAEINNDHYWNKELMRRIQIPMQGSKFYLKNLNLIDRDIPIITQEVLVNRHCTELDLASNRLTSEGARLLAIALETNTTLEILDLSSNRIKDEGVQYLVESLRSHPSLKYLRLGTNAITDVGAEHLARLLLENRRLILLDIFSNELTSRGVISLAKAVPHSCLEYFYIGNNQQVNDDCIDAIITMIRESNNLQAISLSNMTFSEKSKLKLTKAVKSKHSSFLDIPLYT